jgi:hypothetical protein
MSLLRKVDVGVVREVAVGEPVQDDEVEDGVAPVVEELRGGSGRLGGRRRSRGRGRRRGG